MGNENKEDSWFVTISFNIVSDVSPFNGNRMTNTSVFDNDPIKNNCFHPMNKNWVWIAQNCKNDGCPIKTGG